MSFQVGSLVRARGREWVVLPREEENLLLLRPLGGTDADACGIYLPLEPDAVQPAVFSPPNPAQAGDHTACSLLRDAVRLGFRAGAGPFRSLGRIAVEPRPYQLVPLLMALKLSPVRLLIADDVGIGKTVEASLIARELLDRGEISRLCVLCPPHLCEQWQAELAEKFHIEAEVVRPGTVSRLGRDLDVDQSVFDVHPFVVVSIDYIKSDRRREEFVRACPEFVIVDEAHICAADGSGRGQQQRHQLLAQLARDASRHLILVTATPHSGIESSFRSLLSLLNPRFGALPDDLARNEAKALRRELAAHLVQRRRADIRDYLSADTAFPERLTAEITYRLSRPYQQLFDRVFAYANEMVAGAEGLSQYRRRVCWWAALALLRCVNSSPAAAAAALTRRATEPEAEGEAAVLDAIGRRTVMDLDASEAGEQDDAVPGADATGEGGDARSTGERRRLREMARAAEALKGEQDEKLLGAVAQIRRLVEEGFRPVVFCRYVATAEYVAEELRKRLRGVAVESVTGLLPAEERHQRVLELAEHEQRVLVATDCLSEGINLQEWFDAVLHYDLSWNPTRHEQREGRVDRYGQKKSQVRCILYYGADNKIDGAVLRVLLRKAASIRKSLGVSVPVPVDTNQVLEAVFEALFLSRGTPQQLSLDLDETEQRLTREWEAAADREKQSRTLFAQGSLKPDEVARELNEAAAALGGAADTERFVRDVATRLNAPVVAEGDAWRLDVDALPEMVRERSGLDGRVKIGFRLPVAEGARHIARTHPLVEALGAFVTDTALDGALPAVAARCGAIRTTAVTTRTHLLLLRLRFHLETTQRGRTTPLVAEECVVAAFRGRPDDAEWLSPEEATALMDAPPDANVPEELRAIWLSDALRDLHLLEPEITRIAGDRAQALLASHRRVRDAAGLAGIRYQVRPQLPADLLGLYVLMPVARG
jgi:superfamily II DNA or RNA helicase